MAPLYYNNVNFNFRNNEPLASFQQQLDNKKFPELMSSGSSSRLYHFGQFLMVIESARLRELAYIQSRHALITLQYSI